MHTRTLAYFLLMILFLSLLACEGGLGLSRENIFRTGEVIRNQVGQSRVRGVIVDLKKGQEVRKFGHCWSLNPQPELDTLNLLDPHFSSFGPSAQPQFFVSTLENLVLNQVYYVRAYFILGEEIQYAEELILASPQDPNTPLVQSISLNNISSNSALAIGRLQNPGNSTLINYGHCWGLAPTPTLDNEFAISSSGLNSDGIYQSNITALNPGQAYYLRAFIQFSRPGNPGNEVIYGNEIPFQTPN